MSESPHTSPGDKVVARWDAMGVMQRLNLVMENENLFWIMRLITRSEIAALHQIHESEREYDAMRMDQPFFASLNIKKTVAAQVHRDKLKAALWAVFE